MFSKSYITEIKKVWSMQTDKYNKVTNNEISWNYIGWN